MGEGGVTWEGTAMLAVSRWRNIIVNTGRIILAVVLIVTSAVNIVGAALTGRVRPEATLIDRPILFLVGLAVYAVVLLGGLWWLWRAVVGLRAGHASNGHRS
jgi:hypothetical protein